MTEETKKPKPRSSQGEKEIDRLDNEFQSYKKQIDDLNDRSMMPAKEDVEPQTKISQKDINESKDIYLKPKRTIGSNEKFNEKFREDYNFQKEYVMFIAENNEVIGGSIDLWTKPFPGMPAEEWDVPVNKPVWGPRYLAEQIKKCNYRRLRTEEKITYGDNGQFFGGMVAEATVQRLDARPATKKRSIFMGANNF